jgi:hypothetical protein
MASAGHHRKAGEHPLLLAVILFCAAVGAFVMIAAAGYGLTLLARHVLG